MKQEFNPYQTNNEILTQGRKNNDQSEVLKPNSLWNSVWIYFGLTFLWSWLCWIPGILNSQGIIIIHEAIPFFFGIGAIFGPTIIAFFLVGKNQGKEGIIRFLKRIWEWNFSKKWLVPVFLIGPVISFISLGIVILVEDFTPDLSIFLRPWEIIIAFFSIFFTGGPFQEEFGWRGYALDKLQRKQPALFANLLLGAIWSLWHLPLFFISGTSQFYLPIYEFLLQNTIISILYGWIYNNTKGSVGVAMLFHGVLNLTGAILPYWYTTLGRWISFFVTLVLVGLVTWYWGPRTFQRNKNDPKE